MEIDRRSLLKTILVGGAFLAAGVPLRTTGESTAKPRGPVLLVIGGSRRDAAFATGAQAVARMAGKKTVPVYKLDGRFGPDSDLISALFYPRRQTRIIGIMDDGMYTIFHELVRAADVCLVCLGRHGYGGNMAFTHRHTMLSALSGQSIAAAVASQLSLIDQNFLVSETVLDNRSATNVAGNSTLPGFTSYRVTGDRPVRLHLSGLSLSEACGVFGLSLARVTHCATSVVYHPQRIAPSANWYELLGQTVMQAGIGVQPSQLTSGSQVFLHRGSAVGRMSPAETFVTFVMDV
ncbi:MAG: hypothetical protein UZ01_01184 [Candidatus Brocadia sinica]|nr:MAG: hypothetical protein UZ01_01184 [Candidatus Brocadia sinica]